MCVLCTLVDLLAMNTLNANETESGGPETPAPSRLESNDAMHHRVSEEIRLDNGAQSSVFVYLYYLFFFFFSLMSLPMERQLAKASQWFTDGPTGATTPPHTRQHRGDVRTFAGRAQPNLCI